MTLITAELVVFIGDDTYITACEARTSMGDGSNGATWLARIVGSDRRYKLAREFVPKNSADEPGSLSWSIPAPGIYEYRGFEAPSPEAGRGFVRIVNGSVEMMDASVVHDLYSDVPAR